MTKEIQLMNASELLANYDYICEKIKSDEKEIEQSKKKLGMIRTEIENRLVLLNPKKSELENVEGNVHEVSKS